MTRATFSLGGVQDSGNKAANPSRMVNCYVEALKQGSRSTFTIRPVPGQEAFADLGVPLVRAMAAVNGVLYAAANGSLYSVDSMGAVLNLGSIEDDEYTTISGNLDSVAVTAKGVYHVWDGSSITRPSGGSFTNVGSAAFFDYYTVMTEKNGPNFQWSSLADPKTLAPLNVARAESEPDNLLRVMKLGRTLWLFGEESIEIWANSGAANEDAFNSRIESIERGLKGADLVAETNGALFFVGDDDVAYLAQGMAISPLIHPGVETAIRDGDIDRCFYYEDGHHRFACIRFRDRPAWCFDVATGEWHERSSGTTHGAWDVIGTGYAYGQWFVATNAGPIYKTARNGADIGKPLRREITALPAYFSGNPFRVKKIEVLGEYGVHDVGRPARIMLSTSDDGGHTWGHSKDRDVGVPGTFRRRAVWRSMGQFKQLSLKIAMTDPGDFLLYSDGNIEID